MQDAFPKVRLVGAEGKTWRYSMFCVVHPGVRVQASNRNPPASLAALENRLAQLHLVVPILGGGEKHGRPSAADDVLVNGAVMHLVTVGKALGMAAGIIGEAGHVFTEPRGGALEN